MCDCGGAQHPLPVSSDPRDGPLGETGLHSNTAQAAHHGEAATATTVSTKPYVVISFADEILLSG